MGVDYDQVKASTREMWSLGDYTPLAQTLEPAARELVDSCGISSGDEVLDVAAGNGNCAIAAAQKGARVVASDLTPAMVTLGRQRTAAAGFDIEWAEADAEDLPFEENRFDAVTSVFGAMIAPRPDLVASEMFRVVKPGGVVGMANWTPASFMRKLSDVSSKYLPPRPEDFPTPSPGAWRKQSDRALKDWPPASSSIDASSRGNTIPGRIGAPPVRASGGRSWPKGCCLRMSTTVWPKRWRPCSESTTMAPRAGSSSSASTYSSWRRRRELDFRADHAPSGRSHSASTSMMLASP